MQRPLSGTSLFTHSECIGRKRKREEEDVPRKGKTEGANSETREEEAKSSGRLFLYRRWERKREGALCVICINREP